MATKFMNLAKALGPYSSSHMVFVAANVLSEKGREGSSPYTQLFSPEKIGETWKRIYEDTLRTFEENFGFLLKKAALEPDDDDEAYQYRSYLNHIITIRNLRDMFHEEDRAWLNDRQWYSQIFKRLPHKVIEERFQNLVAEEHGADRPNEVNYIIVFGTKQSLLRDIQSTNVRAEYATFNGVKENCTRGHTQTYMKGFNESFGDHHARVDSIKLIDPDTGDYEIVSDSEFSNEKWIVMSGVWNPEKEKYEFHMVENVYLLNQVKRVKGRGNRSASDAYPLALVGWWTWHLDDRITDSRHALKGIRDKDPRGLKPFKASEYAQFLFQTPLAKFGHTVFRFPIADGEGIGMKYDYTPWTSLSHKNQQDEEDNEYAYPNPSDGFFPAPNSRVSFGDKHVIEIPGSYQDPFNPTNSFAFQSINDLFTLTPAQLNVFSNRTNLTTGILSEEVYDPQSFVLNNFLPMNLDPQTPHTSLRQKWPGNKDNRYSTWTKIGMNLIMKQFLKFSIYDQGKPWTGNVDILREILQEEELAGGIVKRSIGTDAIYNKIIPGVLSVEVERWFLARDWKVQIYVDATTNEATHFEAAWPNYLHKNEGAFFVGDFVEEGARGAIGGKIRLYEEIGRYLRRIHHFHSCESPPDCGTCKRLRDLIGFWSEGSLEERLEMHGQHFN